MTEGISRSHSIWKPCRRGSPGGQEPRELPRRLHPAAVALVAPPAPLPLNEAAFAGAPAFVSVCQGSGTMKSGVWDVCVASLRPAAVQ